MILSAAHHLTQRCKAFCFTSHQDWIFCYFKYQKLILSVVQHNLQYQPEICARRFTVKTKNSQLSLEKWRVELWMTEHFIPSPSFQVTFSFRGLALIRTDLPCCSGYPWMSIFSKIFPNFFKESTDLIGQLATGLFLKIERPYRPVLTNSKRP